ncbi:MAG: HEAT repeat domain-containing protein [Planctomycetes bacterium]|nr:HEAT repeat domain-containing protein [Planctomycetota bacterium]
MASDLYFLWSLERVGVTYGLKRLGKTDWYIWGSQELLKSQNSDGSWTSWNSPVVGTSLALLFLNRANVAQDLTELIGGKAPSNGNSEVTLKSGTGTSGLKGTSPPSAGDSADEGASPESLLSELLKAAKGKQLAIIHRLRDAKGGEYTQALAEAIPRLSGSSQESARESLVSRFTRLSPKSLRAWLAEGDREIRLAAIGAMANKNTQELVPDLIQLLVDKEDSVWRGAHQALRKITSEDFGPDAGAKTADRVIAQKRWVKWWEGKAPK